VERLQNSSGEIASQPMIARRVESLILHRLYGDFIASQPAAIIAQGVETYSRYLPSSRRKRLGWDFLGLELKQGVARAAERGVSFVTVHGDDHIVRAAAEGRKGTNLKVLVVPVLTSLDDRGLRELGYRSSVAALISEGAQRTLVCGCDGIIAAPRDNPNEIRRVAGSEALFVVTPGVRLPGSPLDDHKRAGTPADAIAAGADYLVVGRPIIKCADPARAAAAIIDDMRRAA
jgi:orotidine-5'-phosphate decarboxylase